MDSVIYTGSTGEKVEFDLRSPIRLGEGDTLRSREWEYELGYRDITDVSLPARTVSMEVFANPSTCDYMRRVFDRDMSYRSPGTLSVNGWTQRSYVVSSETDEWYGAAVVLSMEVALLDGVWRKSTVLQFLPDDKPIGSGIGKGYPYGYPYGYGTVHSPTSVRQPGYVPAPARIVMFGPATSPSVTIGGNVYSCSADIPAVGYLVLDGIEKTAVMTTQGGVSTNYLEFVSIGTGEGSGEYAFEPIAPGDNPLVWSGAFGFQLEMFEEQTEPDFGEA